MGSTNPVFVLPGAAEAHASEIADRLWQSATNSSGQMCTCPGLIFVAKSAHSVELIKALGAGFDQQQAATVLYPRVQSLYTKRTAEIVGVDGVELRAGTIGALARPAGTPEDAPMPIRVPSALFKVDFETFRKNPALHEEVFGPAAIVVVCDRPQDLVDAAASVYGSLTGTIWAAAADESLARSVQSVLEQRVGRLIYNGVPTGVDVVPAMVHGGPYPATNAPHTSAVGPTAIERWCRPVAYQNTPETFLPAELRNSNPLRIRRLVNGKLMEAEG
jgi:NADP-dependent aldehyde dehydrogenase